MPQSRRRNLTLRSACGRLPIDDLGSSGLATSSKAVLGVHAVEEARIDHHAVAGIGLLGDLEASRRPRLRHHHRHDRQAVLLAKSRSRWSPDGQPKMAPVP